MKRKQAKKFRRVNPYNPTRPQSKATTNSPEVLDNSLDCVLERSVARSGLGYEAFVKQLVQSAFAGLSVWSESDLVRLLVSAERLGLDPLNHEIYAAQSSQDPMASVLVVVSVNGWARILNAHPSFDGMQFAEATQTFEDVPEWMECTIYRKDRANPTTVREYFCEVKGDQGAWLTHPRRMLRHKAMVQCARVCFGLVGIFDPDEASRILHSQSSKSQPIKSQPQKIRSIHGRRAQPSSQESLKAALSSVHP